MELSKTELNKLLGDLEERIINKICKSFNELSVFDVTFDTDTTQGRPSDEDAESVRVNLHVSMKELSERSAPDVSRSIWRALWERWDENNE